MILLRLLGGLALTVNGERVAGRAAQRHRLALLALLGATRVGGVSREKLATYLWPEADRRSRHLLSNSVHLIRKALGDDVILGTADALWLNPDRIRCDLQEFDAALARGDPAAAAELYRGPFLDGFFLSGTQEFETWVELERDRCARAYAQAVATLAAEAEAAEDYRAAAGWWARLVEVDPLAARNVLRLIGALEAAGELEQAVRCGRAYQARVRSELDLEPDRGVTLFVERLVRERSQDGDDGEEPRPIPILAPAPDDVTSRSGRRPIDRIVEVPARRRGRVYALAAIVGGLATVLAFLYGGRRDERSVSVTESSVAVLPFRSVTDDRRDERLADGMTEEIVAELARNRSLRVITATSLRGPRDSPEDTRRIARNLGVSHLLEGSLVSAESRLRVQVRLVEARTGSSQWSETYDRELIDFFDVQAEIARSVASALGVRLADGLTRGPDRSQTRSMAAYELYLRGSDRTALRSDSAARAALEYLRQATVVDPGYAAAYAGMARLYVRMGEDEPSGPPRRELLEQAERAALRAVALDGSLAEAHASLGVVRYVMLDLAGAEAELRRAVELDPTGRFREWLALVYTLQGRSADALRQARLAAEADPLSPTAHAQMARALVVGGRCDEALARLELLADLDPPLLQAAPLAAQCYVEKEMWPEAIAWLERTAQNRTQRGDALLGYVYARAGMASPALKIHDRLLDAWRQGDGDAFAIAISYAGRRELDQALAWLDRSFEDGSAPATTGLTILMEPAFAEVRRDPRFAEVARRLGIRSW